MHSDSYPESDYLDVGVLDVAVEFHVGSARRRANSLLKHSSEQQKQSVSGCGQMAIASRQLAVDRVRCSTPHTLRTSAPEAPHQDHTIKRSSNRRLTTCAEALTYLKTKAWVAGASTSSVCMPENSGL